MEFKPIASSSEGNAYLLQDGYSKLLLECGIRFKDIQKALNFKTSELDGCLVTHEHGDHIKGLQEVLRSGIDTYMSKGTAEATGIDHHRLHSIESRKQFNLGKWTILPFEVEHDVSEPLGFLIKGPSGEKLLFATDTYFLRVRFKELNIIAVECNYSEEILEQNILDGTVPLIMRKRLYMSHFSLENYKDFLKANDLSKVREIWMLHMSNTNGDEISFKKEIQGLTGKPVYIA